MVNGLVSSDTPATPFPSEPEPPSYSPAIPFLLPWGLEPFPFPFDIYIYIFFFNLALAASGKCFLQSICPGNFLLGAQTLPWFSLSTGQEAQGKRMGTERAPRVSGAWGNP